jgi:ATP-binding protein involved in chromosome partitioning
MDRMRQFRTYHQVVHETGSRILEQVLEQRTRLDRRLASVKAVVAVLSGKGGVGKSAITANLAAALAGRGARVGALDADLNGPSLGRMLGVARAPLVDGEAGVEPAPGVLGIRVMSMDLLQEDAAPLRWRAPGGDGFVWRGVAETGVLREFLSDVAWGELDYLLVDLPPGTDRIARLLELVPRPHQTLLITTPAEISRFVVAKSARLLLDAGVSPIGVVANMVPPAREAASQGTAAHALAEEMNLPLWAEIPFDAKLAENTDRGLPFVLASPGEDASRALGALAERVEREAGGRFAS